MVPFFKMTENLKKATEFANYAAAQVETEYVGSEHFIYAFFDLPDCEACKLLREFGVDKQAYRSLFKERVDKKYQKIGFTSRTQTMIENAVKTAEEDGTYASTAHMLYQILQSPACVAVRYLKVFTDVDALREKTLFTINALKFDPSSCLFTSGASGVTTDFPAPLQGENTATQTMTAERQEDAEKKSKYAHKGSEMPDCGIDMTERAKKGKTDPVIGRKKEIEKTVQILSRRLKNNPVLVGEPGVGKSAIIEGLAQLIVEGKVPEQLYNKKIFSVDLPGMLAGTKYRGDFEEKLKDLIDKTVEDGDVVLFIDEIHTLVGAGGTSEGGMDAANILKPMLARGDLQLIGATTVEEYRKYIEKDSALERRFTPVYVEEPSETDTVAILKGLRSKYEQHHGIAITDEAIEAAVQLSMRYITDRFLPDKAIDLVDEAAAKVRIVSQGGSFEMKELEEEANTLENERKLRESRGEYALANEALKAKRNVLEKIQALEQAQKPKQLADGRLAIGREHVAAIVSARMKIPLMKITQEEGEKLMRLEEDLHRRIIGQNEAVSAVAKAIRRARAGLKDPSRPIGSFIFVGPTGVGKTDLCKALAEALFGSEEQMIRLDMSEYMEKQSISKLIGAPPGYVGFEDLQTGQLTEKVRSKPYCVILFDEIEKAHPDVFNLLLQILDDGRLTDSKGRTVSFKNAVIILTSNAGAALGDHDFENGLAAESQYERMKENVARELKSTFRPEFLNRMDDVIVFHSLTQSDCARIGEKIVNSLAKRLMEQRGISLFVGDNALRALVEEGYDPQYGARPLKRVIQRRIEDKLSEEILLGRVKNGQNVKVEYFGGEYFFSTEDGRL